MRQCYGPKRRRLDRVLEALDAALAGSAPGMGGDGLVEQLAALQRDSLGVFGRLASPLSPTAEPIFRRLLTEGWDVPVPALFGQMLLPEPVTVLLERLAGTDGHEVLFERLRLLAVRIVALGASRDPAVADAAQRMGIDWVRSQIADPLPPSVNQVLREAGPALVGLPVIRDGFPLWAAAVSSAAASALSAMAVEAERQGVDIVGALVIPPDAADGRKEIAGPRRSLDGTGWTDGTGSRPC
jgi:hypothetical protein